MATLRDRDLDESMIDERAKVYREALNHLSERMWVHAVNSAVRTLDWFPTIHELLTLAESAPPLDRVPMAVLERIDPVTREIYLEYRSAPGGVVNTRGLTREEAKELTAGSALPVGEIK